MEAFKKKKILKIRESSIEEVEDLIAVEKRVRISVNGRHVMSLYCTPLMIRELIVGILHNEGLITGEWCADRISIEYGDDIAVDIPATGSVSDDEKIVTSGCAGGISIVHPIPDGAIVDDVAYPVDAIRSIYSDFQRRSEGYRLTGGLHSAALSDGKLIRAFCEDIGRHNAVDKVIGYCLLEGIPFNGSIMLASGRLSSEITHKCVSSRIPLLVSRAAPTTQAIRIAEAAGLTLIGFVRAGKMNVYSGRQRILL